MDRTSCAGMLALFTALCGCSCEARASDSPHFYWGHVLGGVGDDRVVALTAYNGHRSCVLATINGAVDLLPGAPGGDVGETGRSSMVLARFDENGDLLHAFAIPNASGTAILADNAHDIYVTGRCIAGVDLDPSAAEYLVEHISAFVARYSETGALIWARTIPAELGNDFQGVELDLDPVHHTLFWLLRNSVAPGIALTSFDTDGRPGRRIDFVTPWTNNWHIACTADALYLCGIAGALTDLAAPPGPSHFPTGTWTMTTFLAKYDHDLGLSWVDELFPFASEIRGMDAAEGRVVIGGRLFGSIDIDPGPAMHPLEAPGTVGGAYVAQYAEANGAYQWAIALQGAGTVLVRDIELDEFGNCWAGGAFSLTCDFDPDPAAATTLTSRGGQDYFLSTLDPNGRFRWAASGGGAADEDGWQLCTTGGKYVFTGGTTRSPAVEFTEGGSTVVSHGLGDLVFAKYAYDGHQPSPHIAVDTRPVRDRFWLSALLFLGLAATALVAWRWRRKKK